MPIADMTFEIRENPTPVELDWTPYTDLYNGFCGTLDYTLSYVSGPICTVWDSTIPSDCSKSYDLIVFDELNTKFTIDPA